MFYYTVRMGLDAQSCARKPGYFANLGFDRTRSALSSTERKFVGVGLIELSDVRNLQSERTKLYQDPVAICRICCALLLQINYEIHIFCPSHS
ncbi:MAG: hypothetical protein IPK61_08015 [Saprospiraceae bacterium]|nr:hypothetical protein [Saprospiraceae bacterium]